MCDTALRRRGMRLWVWLPGRVTFGPLDIGTGGVAVGDGWKAAGSVLRGLVRCGWLRSGVRKVEAIASIAATGVEEFQQNAAVVEHYDKKGEDLGTGYVTTEFEDFGSYVACPQIFALFVENIGVLRRLGSGWSTSCGS